MTQGTFLILLGAVIALTSSIVTALVQHLLTLRAEKLKRKWDEHQKQLDTFRTSLLQLDPALISIREEILRKGSGLLPPLEPVDSYDGLEVFVTRLRQLGTELNWNEQQIEGAVDSVEQYFAKRSVSAKGNEREV